MAEQVRMRWLIRGFGLLWIVLVVASATLSGRALIRYLELAQSEADFVVVLERYRSELVQCELGLGAIVVADTPSGKLAGYEPTTLRPSLRRDLQEAHQAYQKLQTHLEAFLQGDEEQPPLTWLVARLQVEWVQLQASVEQFLHGSSESPPTPALLRRFRGSMQSSLYHTLENLKRTFIGSLHSRQQTIQKQALFYGGLMGIGLLLGFAWLWWRWISPAKRFQRFVEQLNLPIPEHPNEWLYAQEALEYFQGRLRGAEAFMRDLAMGRIPEPILPESENDPLARSSRWLLQRFEQLRDAERYRQAV